MNEHDALPDYWTYPTATRQMDLSEIVNAAEVEVTISE